MTLPSRNKHKIAVQLFEQAGFRVYRSSRMPLNEIAVRRARAPYDAWICVTLDDFAVDSIERAIAEVKDGYTEHQRRARDEGALPVAVGTPSAQGLVSVLEHQFPNQGVREKLEAVALLNTDDSYTFGGAPSGNALSKLWDDEIKGMARDRARHHALELNDAEIRRLKLEELARALRAYETEFGVPKFDRANQLHRYPPSYLYVVELLDELVP